MKLMTAPTWGLKPDFLLEYYKKYIRSKIEYASEIYFSAPGSTLRRLDLVQNSALRIAFGARRTTPAKFLISESGIEDLECRRKIKNLRYCKRLWSAKSTHPIKSHILKPGHWTTGQQKVFKE